jgi:hypothetical protein
MVVVLNRNHAKKGVIMQSTMPSLTVALPRIHSSRMGSGPLPVVDAQAACNIRRRNRSKLARPYMLRFSSFSLLMWPSVTPLDHA